MKNLFESIVRTFVPIVIGAVVTFFTGAGIELDPQFVPALEAVLFTGSTTLYYVLVRLLEHYVNPHFGWLLGLAKEPEYKKSVTK